MNDETAGKRLNLYQRVMLRIGLEFEGKANDCWMFYPEGTLVYEYGDIYYAIAEFFYTCMKETSEDWLITTITFVFVVVLFWQLFMR